MILITGASGMLGSHILFQLCKTENRIRAIKRENSNIKNVLKIFSFYSNEAENLLSKVEWVTADILNQDQLNNAFEGVKKVYHCAAKISFSKNHKTILFQTNVEGTKNIVNLCLYHKVEKLCHVSSVAAIGSYPNGETVNEQTPWTNSPENSSYSLSKYHGELEVWRGIEEGLNAVIVNPAVILGPGNWTKGSSKMFSLVYNGLSYYSTGITGFVDVKDVVFLIIELMESKINSERFILSSENISFKKILGYIARSMNKTEPRWKISYMRIILMFRIKYFVEMFTNKEAFLSKELLKFAKEKSRFDNKKILTQIPFSFKLVQESCNEISALFLKDKS
tara:strand:+ start:1085 stop:2095 length:1011 start_codon:yes stop_codon:yes gene_type:complete